MNIGKLTREGLAKAKARGVKLGNPSSLSEARDIAASVNTSKANEYALELMPIINGCVAVGVISNSAISRHLNKIGKPTQRGKSWTPGGVRNIRIRLDKLNK